MVFKKEVILYLVIIHKKQLYGIKKLPNFC